MENPVGKTESGWSPHVLQHHLYSVSHWLYAQPELGTEYPIQRGTHRRVIAI